MAPKRSNLDAGDQIILKLNEREANFNLKFEEMKIEFEEAITQANSIATSALNITDTNEKKRSWN